METKEKLPRDKWLVLALFVADQLNTIRKNCPHKDFAESPKEKICMSCCLRLK